MTTNDKDQRRERLDLVRRRTVVALGALGAELALGCSSDDDQTPDDTGDSTGEATDGSDGSSGDEQSLLDWPEFPDQTQCVLAPDSGEGPYYFDSGLERNDVREGRPGAELRLRLRINDSNCEPLPGLRVEIFQADARGVYSAFANDPDLPPNFGGGLVDPDETYCRGFQVTDRRGQVEFVTLYPGWYTTRAPHIHVIVALDDVTLFGAMVLLDHDLTVALYQSREPYLARPQMHTTNEEDPIQQLPVLQMLADGDIYWGSATLQLLL